MTTPTRNNGAMDRELRHRTLTDKIVKMYYEREALLKKKDTTLEEDVYAEALDKARDQLLKERRQIRTKLVNEQVQTILHDLGEEKLANQLRR